MKVNGFACDQCERFFENNDDFYTVNRGDFIVEVCCSVCLRKMASELVGAEAATTPKPAAKPKNPNPNEPPNPMGRPAVPSDKAIEAAQNRLVRLNNTGAGGATPNKEPCDVCGRVFPSRQGFAAHRRKAHGKAGLPTTRVTPDGVLVSDDGAKPRPSRAQVPGLDFNGLGGNGRTTEPVRVESDS